MVFLCVSCSSKTYEEKRAIEISKQAIKVIDSYLDFEIDAKELDEELHNLKDRMPDVPEDASVLDTLWQIDADLLCCCIYASSVSWDTVRDSDELSESEKDLLDARNDLAEDIGAKKR